jgi:hypothetical protein
MGFLQVLGQKAEEKTKERLENFDNAMEEAINSVIDLQNMWGMKALGLDKELKKVQQQVQKELGKKKRKWWPF